MDDEDEYEPYHRSSANQLAQQLILERIKERKKKNTCTLKRLKKIKGEACPPLYGSSAVEKSTAQDLAIEKLSGFILVLGKLVARRSPTP